MNVSCGSCPAKYAVPDDKVRGRKVRIKCKRCGSPIVVDGTSLGEETSAAPVNEQSKPVASGPPAADPTPPVAQAVSGKRTMLGVPAPATLSAAAPRFGGARLAQAPAAQAPAAQTAVAQAPTAQAPITQAAARGRAEAAATSAAQAADRNAQPVARKQTMLGGMSAPQAAVAAVPEAFPAPAPEEPPWTIAINDEQQVEGSLDEIVDLYRSGTIDAETFIWRDGMADWSTPFEIPEVSGALEAAGFRPEPEGNADESAVDAGDDQEEATRVVDVAKASQPSGGWHEPAAPEPRRPSQGSVSFEDETVTMQESQAEDLMRMAAARDVSQAARRAQAPPQDLFGNLERAGSEEEATEEPEPEPELHGDAARKLTGARNESSVLFSLEALTKMAEPPDRSAPDASFLETKPSPSDRAPDSLINMGGGNLSGSPLAAPDFNVPPPPPAPVSLGPASVPDLAAFAPRRSRGKIVLVVLVVLLGAAGAAGYVLKQPASLFGPEGLLGPEGGLFGAGEGTPGTGSDDAPLAPERPGTPASETADSKGASDTSGSETAGAETRNSDRTDRDGPSRADATGTAANPGAAAADNAQRPRSVQDQPRAAAAAPAEPEPRNEPEPAPEPASAAPPFDRNAAAAALGSAAGSVTSCRSASGPTGSGKAIVTFSPSGRVTTATVTGDFAGTQVGGCVARLFRNAKIPAFSGDSVTVSKSFSIE